MINWPFVSPIKAWTGAVSTDWSNAGNWSPAGAPTLASDVTIGPAANQPTLTAASVANSVTISGAGGQLTIGGQTFSVTQAAASCTYALVPTSQSVVASGGTGSTTVTTLAGCAWRSEERRVGKESCVSCRSRWSPYH